MSIFLQSLCVSDLIPWNYLALPLYNHKRFDLGHTCWRRLLKVPWTTRRSNKSILKEVCPGCSLEGLMLKLNSNTLATSWEELTHWKRLWCWEGLEAGGEGDDRGWEGWHHRLIGRESEWTPGVGDGQGGLACCNSWGCKELDTTEGLKWTEPNRTEWSSGFPYFLQFKSEFGNKEFVIWATGNSWSCFCGLHRASPSLTAKNIINLISVLTIW